MIGKRKLTKQDKELLACFNVDSPSDLVFWSFRYFLGRMTIHASCFADELATCWPHLEPRVQALIKRELEEEFERDDRAREDREKNPESIYKFSLPLGHDCDRASWQRIRDAYSKEQQS